jgi:hypothetical protein
MKAHRENDHELDEFRAIRIINFVLFKRKVVAESSTANNNKARS